MSQHMIIFKSLQNQSGKFMEVIFGVNLVEKEHDIQRGEDSCLKPQSQLTDPRLELPSSDSRRGSNAFSTTLQNSALLDRNCCSAFQMEPSLSRSMHHA